MRDIYGKGQFGLSFEVFPPKSTDADDALVETLERLAAYQPSFISCTYGAGGTTRVRTLEWCETIQNRFGTMATAHFTCVGATRDQLLEWLQLAESKGIKNIMALRGDPPQGEQKFQAVEGGFRYANELVTLIRGEFPQMGIGVAGYPEKHPEATDADVDLQNLKRKVDAGADVVVSQLFYRNANYFAFLDRFRQAGIRVPLVPGIMPITEFARIKRIAAMCGAVVPDELASRLEAAQDDKEAQFEIGVEWAIDQCRELMDQGVPGIHFYVLNRSQACERILGALGLSAKVNA